MPFEILLQATTTRVEFVYVTRSVIVGDFEIRGHTAVTRIPHLPICYNLPPPNVWGTDGRTKLSGTRPYERRKST